MNGGICPGGQSNKGLARACFERFVTMKTTVKASNVAVVNALTC